MIIGYLDPNGWRSLSSLKGCNDLVRRALAAYEGKRFSKADVKGIVHGEFRGLGSRGRLQAAGQGKSRSSFGASGFMGIMQLY